MFGRFKFKIHGQGEIIYLDEKTVMSAFILLDVTRLKSSAQGREIWCALLNL